MDWIEMEMSECYERERQRKGGRLTDIGAVRRSSDTRNDYYYTTKTPHKTKKTIA